MQFLQNILLGLTLSAPIGPVNISAIKNGLKHGFFPAFFIGLGAITVDLCYLLLIYFGLSKYLLKPVIQHTLPLFGSGVLLYLGSKSLWEALVREKLDGLKVLTNQKYYRQGVLIAASSPLTVLWWIGIFGTVLSSEVRDNTASFINSWGVLVGCFCWIVLLAFLVHAAKDHFNQKFYRLISLLAGLGLIGFGLSFLWESYKLLM